MLCLLQLIPRLNKPQVTHRSGLLRQYFYSKAFFVIHMFQCSSYLTFNLYPIIDF